MQNSRCKIQNEKYECALFKKNITDSRKSKYASTIVLLESFYFAKQIGVLYTEVQEFSTKTP